MNGNGDSNARGTDRHEQLMGLGRTWLVFIFGVVLLAFLFPGTFSRRKALVLAAYFLYYLGYMAWAWRSPTCPWAGRLRPTGAPWSTLVWYAAFIVDLSYISTVLYLGGGYYALVLLYPLIMMGVALCRPNFRDFLLAGFLGHLSYAGSLFLLYRSLAFYRRLDFWATSIAEGAVFLATLLVVKVLSEEKSRLIKVTRQLAEANRDLQVLAATDALTGLYNYRYFRERLEKEIRQAAEGGYPVTLALFDIDYLRLYNETYGPREGDRVLNVLAGLLREMARPGDAACRLQGDLFAVLMAGLPPVEGVRFIQQVRRAFACQPIPGRETQPLGTMTLTAGLAGFPLHAANAEELLKRADDALQHAKQRERDSVQVYHSLLQEFRDSDLADKSLLDTVQTLLMVINAKDRYTYGHSERVVLYATLVAEEMGLPPEELRVLKYAAFLHDIGKIEISREVLLKEGPLTEQEKKIMKLHTLFGVHIIEPLHNLRGLVPIVRHHHERFDGTGYPDGLQGEDIPLGARILAVADSFDAMRSNRPYRRAMSFESAVEEIRRYSGSQFDPAVVEAFRAAAVRIRQAEQDLWAPAVWHEVATAGR